MICINPVPSADPVGDRRPFTFLTIETTAPQLKKCALNDVCVLLANAQA